MLEAHVRRRMGTDNCAREGALIAGQGVVWALRDNPGVQETDHSPIELGCGVPRWRRRSDIQGLRGVAVLLVVVFHAGLTVPGGFTGVDIFFVISGFVIGGVLINELERSGRITIARFYGRRIRRLLPALGLMLTTVALAGILLAPVAGERADGITGLLASLFSANFYLLHAGAGYFAPSEALNPFLHTWTLGVEEQFYVFFPTVLAVGWIGGRRLRLGNGRFSAALVVAAISLISFALSLKLSSGAPGGFAPRERFSFYGSPTRAWEFGLGTLLVLASPFLARLPVVIAGALGVGGLGAILIGATTIHGTSNYPGLVALVPTLGACAILAAGTAGERGVIRAIGVRPLVWVGDLSYGWYLWHWPFIVFSAALWPARAMPASILGAGLSVIPAWASLRYVENPIRSKSRLMGRRLLAVAAACVSVPVLACVVFIGASDILRSQPALAAWGLSQEMHLDHLRGCDLGQPFGLQPAQCSWTVRGARGRLVLVGDSYAGHITEAVIRAGNAEGFDVIVVTFPACPFLNIRVYEIDRSEAQCRRYYSHGLRTMIRVRPSLVVTSFRADHYTEDSSIRLGLGEDGSTTNSKASKERVLERGLASTLEELNSAGIPVLLVDPVPSYPSPMGACAAVWMLSGSCPSSAARRVEDQKLAGPIRIDKLAIRHARLSSRLDLVGRLCGRTRCSEVVHGLVTYRDQNHLSVAGARRVADLFMHAIERRTAPPNALLPFHPARVNP
jgi:peptidoglycan/LPS O-acetylase OafA/YrhL